jgi:hypothetical protein
MNRRKELKCFFSMRYSSDSAKRIFVTLSRVCRSVGLTPCKGARGYEPWSNVRGKIERAIDGSFVVVVDTSAFSWWVAFELYHSVGRKICIPLVLDETQGSAPPGEQLPSVFPDIDHLRYHARARDSLQVQLRDALLTALEGAQAWSAAVSRSSIKAYAPERPFPYVEPRLSDHLHKKDPIQMSRLFESWLSPDSELVCDAIIAPPGSGKTLLLSEFARWLNEHRPQHPNRAADLSPVTIFLPATELPEGSSLVTYIKRQSIEMGKRSLPWH